MKEVHITGSIVLYKNNYETVEAAIKSFLSTNLEVFLFLIDNSPSSELKRVATLDPRRICYIFNQGNPGFGAAHNIAIQKCISLKPSYHLALNPDVYFEADTLERLFNYMEAHKTVGLVMPRVLYPNGKLQYLCRKNPTFANLCSRRFFPGIARKLFSNWVRKNEYRHHDYDKIICNVPFLSGCFMFLRMKTLEETGGFDERFFLYMEDADLTRRILQKSNTVYYPEATIYHHYSKISYTNIRLTIHHVRSAISYFNKWGWMNKKK